MLLKDLYRRLWPKRKPIPYVPRQIVGEEDLIHATRDEILLIRANIARSPLQARKLMELHSVTRAVDLLVKLPRKRRGVSWRQRLVWLLMRWEGATTKKWWKGLKPDHSIPMEIRYKE